MTDLDPAQQLRASWVQKIKVTLVEGATAPGECWLWTGAIDKQSGYGRVYLPGKRCGHLHRVTYERFVGPIAEGLHIDHLCRVRACCNPNHLEAVSPMTNSRRGIRGSQTHCKNGHPLSGDNLYISRGSRPQYVHRTCRTCRDKNVAEWRARRKLRQEATWAAYFADREAAS